MSLKITVLNPDGTPSNVAAQYVTGASPLFDLFKKNGMVTRHGTPFGYDDLKVRVTNMKRDEKARQFRHPSGQVVEVVWCDMQSTGEFVAGVEVFKSANAEITLQDLLDFEAGVRKEIEAQGAPRDYYKRRADYREVYEVRAPHLWSWYLANKEILPG